MSRITNRDGSLVTPASRALRKATRKAGWDVDRERLVNPVMEKIEAAARKAGWDTTTGLPVNKKAIDR